MPDSGRPSTSSNTFESANFCTTEQPAPNLCMRNAYTHVLPTGFYVELLERRGGYDGYGTPNIHVRLAAQLGPVW
jgi:hypothetical protein